MAINYPMLKEVVDRASPGQRIASMGYPDILAPLPAIQSMLGASFDNLAYREDSNLICKRHGLREYRIPDADSFFSLLGLELKVFDIVRERGNEIIQDLNYPVEDETLHGTFDFVIDVGTLEHCFNIAQAAITTASLVRKGGYILHENPFNWGNHGFYGLCPTWYADFYEQNGFKLITCLLRTRGGDTAQPPLTERFRCSDKEFNVFAVAQRTEERRYFIYPLQSREMAIASTPPPGFRAIGTPPGRALGETT